MNRTVITAIAAGLSCLLAGCSTVRLGAFREVGSPVDNKAVLYLIDIDNRQLAKVLVDDELANPYYFFYPTTSWHVEMLPGRHQIDVEWRTSHLTSVDRKQRPKSLSHKGEFVAENGKEYYLFIDKEVYSHSYSSGSYYEINSTHVVNGVSILEFPVDFHPTNWKIISTFMKYTDGKTVPNYELLRKFKTVGILHRSEGGSSATTSSTADTATFGLPMSGSATSGDSKTVNIGTGAVSYSTDNIKLGLAMSFMENECTRQGIHVLTRSDFEDKVRAVLKKNGADSIKIQYKDDGITKTITLASAGPTSRAQTTPELPKEEITVGCETVDRLGRRASVLNAFEMPEQAKADASVPMLLAVQNLSPVRATW